MRLRLLIKNFLSYGIMGIVAQILPMFVLPLITRLLTPEYIGINDLFVTVISMGTQIVILGMYDATFRLSFERDDFRYRSSVCSTALAVNFLVYCACILFIVFCGKDIAEQVFGNVKYINMVYLAVLGIGVSVCSSMLILPTRIENNRKIYCGLSLMSPLVSYIVVFFLINKKEYEIALPMGTVISMMATAIIGFLLNKKYYSIKDVNSSMALQLLTIGIPTMPSLLVYWVFNSADRIMIGHYCGNDAVGIYAIGSKLGLVANFIYIAFQGGWQHFVFSTMKDEDQVELISKIYEYLSIISSVMLFFVLTVSKPMFPILFGKEYEMSYMVAPYLFMSPLLLMLYQTIGNQFLVIKKTWISMFVLIIGAAVNVLFNVILIPIIGIEGAALGTLFGYFISLLVANIILIKMNLLRLSKRVILCLILTILLLFMWRQVGQYNIFFQLIVSISATAIYFVWCREDIIMLIKKINK